MSSGRLGFRWIGVLRGLSPTYYHFVCISYTGFRKKAKKRRKKLAAGAKRAGKTQETVGTRIRERSPDEETGFIREAESGMIFGTNGQGEHGGLGVFWGKRTAHEETAGFEGWFGDQARKT